MKFLSFGVMVMVCWHLLLLLFVAVLLITIYPPPPSRKSTSLRGCLCCYITLSLNISLFLFLSLPLLRRRLYSILVILSSFWRRYRTALPRHLTRQTTCSCCCCYHRAELRRLPFPYGFSSCALSTKHHPWGLLSFAPTYYVIISAFLSI